MFNNFRPPQLPQTHVGGWFFRDCNTKILPTVPSQVYPQKSPKKLAANGKGLWSGGAFETPLPERPPI